MHIDGSRHTFGLACWHGDPGPMTVAHRHDDIELNIADRELGYLLNGERMTIPAGRVGMFWAARPHQLIDVAAGTRVTWLTVPLPEFLGWGLPDGVATAFVQGRMLIPDVAPDEAGARFAQWSEDSAGHSEFVARTAGLEVQAFLRRLSLAPDAAASRPRARAGAVEGVAVMAAFVAARSADQIRIADVAASAHLAPSYAMALFKRTVGISIGSYLVQCRVAQAQRLLLTTRRPVGDIAMAAGFGSHSQFHERFRAACGTTPAAYRRGNCGIPHTDAGEDG